MYLALLSPGDTVLSMALDAGGHLSHGAPPNISGKWMNAVHYGVSPDDGLIDMDEVARLAAAHRPRLVICGGSAYPRVIDFAAFRRIADDAGAWLLADMAHFAGLVAGGQHPSPIPHAHASTATTYKNLRGVRGGIILTNEAGIAKKIDSSVFPGIQGSVIMNAVAAKAVCLGEALRPEFKDYARNVLANARALAASLVEEGVDMVTGGTDTPLMLADLRRLGLTGDVASESLERAGLTCNKNTIRGDPEPPGITSGLRFGVSADTTRGFDEDVFRRIGALIAMVLKDLAGGGDSRATEKRCLEDVREFCRRFPVYPEADTR